MNTTRFYHVRWSNGIVKDITIYATLTEKEVMDGGGDMHEGFANEKWNDRDEHRLMSEEELEILKRKIENALKEK